MHLSHIVLGKVVDIIGNLKFFSCAKDQVNPVYVPRNHLVEQALEAATAGDLGPFDRLLDVVRNPFEERPGLEDYAAPAPADLGAYTTFCGT